jgi:hypothetical protein
MKTKEKYKLLGSDSTLESLKNGIANFYFMRNADTLELVEITDKKEYLVYNCGTLMEGVRVIKNKNRFRFEGLVL